jgi:signal transduction histidine kinase
LGQSLAALKLLIQTHCADINGPVPLEVKEFIFGSLDDVIGKTRNLALGLRPTIVANRGLTESIKQLAQDFESKYKMKIALKMPNLSSFHFAGDRINLYRIFQESLTNIVKHSEASNVNISVRRYNQSIVAKISDNGCGFAFKHFPQNFIQSDSCLGIQTMKERTRILKGKIDIQSKKGEGTTVKLTLPYTN